MVVPKAPVFGEAMNDASAREPAEFASLELFCPFASGLNPAVELVQMQSIRWAERIGIVRSEKERAHLNRAKIAWLNAHAFHSAPEDVLQLAVDWTTLFCVLDDLIEVHGRRPVDASAYLSRMLQSFRGLAPAAADDPMANGLDDLRRRMLELAGERWTERFADCLEELFGAFIWEELNRWKQIRPGPNAYRVMRAVTVGLRPQFMLGELADGIELSDRCRQHPDILRLEAFTCNAVGWANDIFTYAKELEYGEVHNLVLVLMESEALSLVDALRRATAIHDQEIRNFLAMEARLPDFAQEQDAVQSYVRMLRCWIRGHLDWSRETRR